VGKEKNISPFIEAQKLVDMPCLACRKPVKVSTKSHEYSGIFNVFCNGDCEDLYAARF
jgi:hypothetical protein